MSDNFNVWNKPAINIFTNNLSDSKITEFNFLSDTSSFAISSTSDFPVPKEIIQDGGNIDSNSDISITNIVLGIILFCLIVCLTIIAINYFKDYFY